MNKREKTLREIYENVLEAVDLPDTPEEGQDETD